MIAISACLLGHHVSYDGAHQAHAILIQHLADRYQLISVCPELEIGLGVPRDKIELRQQGENIHLLSSISPRKDLTEQMVNNAQRFINSYQISGMILKDKSPSCGVGNCKQWKKHGEMQNVMAPGFLLPLSCS